MSKPKSLNYVLLNKNNSSIQKRTIAGVHLILDFWGGKEIEDKNKIKEILLNTAKKIKSESLKVFVYKFNPHGITGVILLCESHITIHSWPEINYVAIDIFTCGDKANPYKALDYLKKEFKPRKIEFKKVGRGKIKNFLNLKK